MIFQGEARIHIPCVVEGKLRHSEVACGKEHSWAVEGASSCSALKSFTLPEMVPCAVTPSPGQPGWCFPPAPCSHGEGLTLPWSWAVCARGRGLLPTGVSSSVLPSLMAWDQPCPAVLRLLTDPSLSHPKRGTASTAASWRQRGLCGLQGKPLLMWRC